VNLNNDGFHFNSCEYVQVSNCEIRCQDDACALFGSNKFVTITNCAFSTRWSVFRFGGGEAQNITVSNCLIYETYGCPIKLSSGGNSRIENLSFSNIVMKNVTGPVGIGFSGQSGRNQAADAAPSSGYVRNLSFHNIRATLVTVPVQHSDMPFIPKVYPGEQNSCFTLNGVNGAWIENVSLSDIHIISAGGGTAEQAAKRDVHQLAAEYFGVWNQEPLGPPAYGLYARNVRGLSANNVRLECVQADARPAVVFDNVQDATVLGLTVGGSPDVESALRIVNSRDVLLTSPRLISPAPVFLQVEGEGNERITVDGGDISKAGKPLATARGASEKAVRLRI
jgi:polygalacturonase